MTHREIFNDRSPLTGLPTTVWLGIEEPFSDSARKCAIQLQVGPGNFAHLPADGARNVARELDRLAAELDRLEAPLCP